MSTNLGDVSKSVGAGAAKGAAIGSVIPVVGTAVGGFVGAILGGLKPVGEWLGIGPANHDQQNHLADLWNSGQISGSQGAILYFKSWIEGVGRSHMDHFNAMFKLYQTALSSQQQGDADANNAYLKSYLEGVGSPIPVELLMAYWPNKIGFLQYSEQTQGANMSTVTTKTLGATVSTSSNIWVVIVGVLLVFIGFFIIKRKK
jgi:LPXTG-motif cell wall-anchored protein